VVRSHYHLTQPGKTKRAAAKNIAVKSVTIDPLGLVITVVAAKYDAKKPLKLTIAGLTDRQARLLASTTVSL
jgi:hypothetical protein